ncbi:hypothetical protein ELOC111193_17100 [Elizabethkingia occulta]|uniref:Fibrobacter succinogenes major paralogous domain-containing protein n=1 Tax=Elizabethkingia occulta TaxID=1867263 RepID=A0A1T3MVS1_9FLAO|nr:hypothetical protein [Elizabethkingia occulta]OPC68370.1 hypothetical protein BAZ10_12855 [Elizabethkingia occulta]
MKTKTFLKTLYLLSFGGSLLFTTSCRSEQQDTTTENIKGISFNIGVENFGEVNARSQVNTKSNYVDTGLTNREEFTSGAFSIVSELSVDNTVLKTSPRSFLPGARQFRIVAYDAQTGDYTAQDIGSTSNPNQQLFANINMVGGKKYTFVTYSLNTTTPPPPAPTTNLNQAKLNLTGLNGEEAGTDLLYAINENVMISGGNTPISVILKHQFSRISISVDDSNAKGTPGQSGYIKGGYPLENNNTGGFIGIIPDFFVACNMNMKNASITDGNNQGLAIPNITTIPKTFIINTGKNTAYKSTLIIPSRVIVIGNDFNSTRITININGTNDNGLQPGKSYTLKLKFNSDRYVDGAGITQSKNDGRYAVIGGYQWDRFNLGTTANHPALSDPDMPSAEIHGAKYTYGAYTGQSGSYLSQYDDQNGGTVSGWESNGNYWNTNDPCETESSGYRIPTKDEYDKLIAFTNNTTVGIYGSYSYGRKLQSKRSDVQLVFPAAGFRSTGNSPGNIIDRGKKARYWNSSSLFDDTTATTSPHPSIGAAIRCIRKK